MKSQGVLAWRPEEAGVCLAWGSDSRFAELEQR